MGEGLAAGRGSGDDDVLAVADGIDGLGLVDVEAGGVAGLEDRNQRGRQWRAQPAVAGATGRESLDVDDLAPVAGLAFQLFDYLADAQLG
ncbi:MAG: hypothetical protein JSV36_08780 [Anaerolineae bacterium]|nr:MAG: hypothetical protein JSV36_08780 [Anaerolineae bacterium]